MPYAAESSNSRDCEIKINGKYLKGKCESNFKGENILNECRDFKCKIPKKVFIKYFSSNICGVTTPFTSAREEKVIATELSISDCE
jgi:hypothetical protein